MKEYLGFSVREEIYRFLEVFKIPGIRTYQYDKDLKKLKPLDTFCHNDVSSVKNLVDVALVQTSDTQTHAVYIKDIAAASGLKVCEKCNYAVFQMNRYKKHFNNPHYYEHTAKCTGKLPSKDVIVSKVARPFCPHITKNPTFKYLLAHGRENEFKPTRYFITFDIETVEIPILNDMDNEEITTSKTVVLSSLAPLSISMAINTRDRIITEYFDVRNGDNFIIQAIRKMFEYGRQIIQDNAYESEDIPYNKNNEVTVLGYNSSKFDLNGIFSALHNPPEWRIVDILGTLNNFKQLRITNKSANKHKRKKRGKKKKEMVIEEDFVDGFVELERNIECGSENECESESESKTDTERITQMVMEETFGDDNNDDEDDDDFITLRFIDALNFTSPMSLEKFVESYKHPNETTSNHKGVFPYESFNESNMFEVLDKDIPFEKTDFKNHLKNTKEASEEEYVEHLNAWEYMRKNGGRTRWDYLKCYNIQDVFIMINPINFLIEDNFKEKVDMLHYVSAASCAQARTYASLYSGMRLDESYITDDPDDPDFKLTMEWLEKKIKGYNEQDVKRKRGISQNITINDFNAIQNLLESQHNRCYLDNHRFTNSNKPTFDRIDNKKPHTLDNIKLACFSCNAAKSNHDNFETHLNIQMMNYFIKNNLPCVPTDVRVVKLLEKCKCGGLANVLHRYNKAGETEINRFYYEDGKVKSKDTGNIMSHVIGYDGISLYPSSRASIQNDNIEFTGGVMLMPGNHKEYITNKSKILQIIQEQKELFAVSIKAHLPKHLWNDYINDPPFWIPVEVEKGEVKLTQCLDTNDKFVGLCSYQVWQLLKMGAVIDDVEEMATFYSNTAFNSFVVSTHEARMEAIRQENVGLQNSIKLTANSSYGKDGMNAAKYSSTFLYDRNTALLKQTHPNFISCRKISDNLFAVQMRAASYRITTPLQCAVFTLDNSKYWMKNFVYNFIYKCVDLNHIHVIGGDTDSKYFAVAGDPTKGTDQGLEYVIKNMEIYKENKLKWIPDEKKLLGFAVENYGPEMYAISPKVYYMYSDKMKKGTLKLKGVSVKRNPQINKEAYISVLTENKTVMGVNVGFVSKVDQLLLQKIEVHKNALVPKHNKMIVLENQSCAPIIKGLDPKKDYIIAEI
jgi:hypothetical protein